MNRIPLILSIILFGTYLILKLLHVNHWIALSIFLIPIIGLIVSFGLRKKLKYKNWFLSPNNFFVERNQNVVQSDIDSELLFEKLLELIKESDFKLFDIDRENHTLLCGTSVNFSTWGENVYLSIKQLDENSSEVSIESATIFGSTSWGRNEKNYKSFVDQLENSLTV